MAKTLGVLKGLQLSGLHKVPQELHNDLEWWEIFLSQYNVISMMAMENWSKLDAVFASGACLAGGGTWFKKKTRLFHTQFPEFIKHMSLHINALELLTIIVATKAPLGMKANYSSE